MRKDTLMRVEKIFPLTSSPSLNSSAWRETPSVWEKGSKVSARLHREPQLWTAHHQDYSHSCSWLLVGSHEARTLACSTVIQFTRPHLVPAPNQHTQTRQSLINQDPRWVQWQANYWEPRLLTHPSTRPASVAPGKSYGPKLWAHPTLGCSHIPKVQDGLWSPRLQAHPGARLAPMRKEGRKLIFK